MSDSKANDGRSMSLGDYLQEHFVDKASFASLSGLAPDRLERLIAAEAIPMATYLCDGKSIHSAVFGATEIEEPLAGEFFRPECVRWAKIAAAAPAGSERTAVLAQLTRELRLALRDFLDNPTAIEERIHGFLPSFWDGTFGLCVSDPSTGEGIARKEMLQEKLTALTANGSDPSPAGISPEELLRLVDDFAAAAMPFSPAEYARSSRKRLVDDLRLAVTKRPP